jgi:hypothetical protein
MHEIQTQQLNTENQNLKECVLLSGINGSGLNDLEKAVKTVSTKFMQKLEQVPVAFSSLDLFLSARNPESAMDTKRNSVSPMLQQPFVDWNTFSQLAYRCGIRNEAVLESAQYLNDIGCLVYFSYKGVLKHNN